MRRGSLRREAGLVTKLAKLGSDHFGRLGNADDEGANGGSKEPDEGGRSDLGGDWAAAQ